MKVQLSMTDRIIITAVLLILSSGLMMLVRLLHADLVCELLVWAYAAKYMIVVIKGEYHVKRK
jgi:hypothetical protein